MIFHVTMLTWILLPTWKCIQLMVIFGRRVNRGDNLKLDWKSVIFLDKKKVSGKFGTRVKVYFPFLQKEKKRNSWQILGLDIKYGFFFQQKKCSRTKIGLNLKFGVFLDKKCSGQNWNGTWSWGFFGKELGLYINVLGSLLCPQYFLSRWVNPIWVNYHNI